MITEDDLRRVRLALTHIEAAKRELQVAINQIAGVPGIGWGTPRRFGREQNRIGRLYDNLERRLYAATWREDPSPPTCWTRLRQ